MKSPKDIVKEGYDKLSTHYRLHFGAHKVEYVDWITELMRLLQPGSTIIELGCGDGIPVAQMLTPVHHYIGIDISSVQIENATRNVPSGRFVVTDMSAASFEVGQYHAIIALYSVIHVPVAEQESLLRKIFRGLRQGGYFLCTLGTTEWTGTDDHWIQRDTKMYWSHANDAQYEAWYRSIGFVVIRKEFVPEGNSGHTFFLVQKPRNS